MNNNIKLLESGICKLIKRPRSPFALVGFEVGKQYRYQKWNFSPYEIFQLYISPQLEYTDSCNEYTFDKCFERVTKFEE